MGTKRLAITHQWLVDMGACSGSRAKFRKLFPKGYAPATIDEALETARFIAAGEVFPIDWLQDHLTKKGEAVFERRMAEFETYPSTTRLNAAYEYVRKLRDEKQREVVRLRSAAKFDSAAFTKNNAERESLSSARVEVNRNLLRNRLQHRAESLVRTAWQYGWAKPPKTLVASRRKQARSYDKARGK